MTTKLRGPKGLPFVGNLFDAQGEGRMDFFINCQREYGDVVPMRFLGRDAYLMSDPELIHQVLVKQASKFHKTTMLKRTLRPTLGEGLLTSEDEFHKRQRKLTQPAFHMQRIANYAETMVTYTQRTLAKWEANPQIEIHHEMMELTMQIVAKTLFDADIADEADEIGDAISLGIETAAERIGKVIWLPEWLPTQKNREIKESRQLLEDTIYGMIQDRRESGEDKGDLLSMLLLSEDEDGNRMTDKQVRDEAMTLFIAGHETTANALTFTFYLLAQHPDVEAKLLDEIRTVLEGGAPTMDDLAQLTYTHQVIKEAMRLYPPAWITAREAIDSVQIGEHSLDVGNLVFISPYIMHRHPQHWDEPDSFKPERFTPEMEKSLPKLAYMPFGGGPRVCIGNHFAMMEAVLVVATILSQVCLKLEDDTPLELDPLITLRPKFGIGMRAVQH